MLSYSSSEKKVWINLGQLRIKTHNWFATLRFNFLSFHARRLVHVGLSLFVRNLKIRISLLSLLCLRILYTHIFRSCSNQIKCFILCTMYQITTYRSSIVEKCSKRWLTGSAWDSRGAGLRKPESLQDSSALQVKSLVIKSVNSGKILCPWVGSTLGSDFVGSDIVKTLEKFKYFCPRTYTCYLYHSLIRYRTRGSLMINSSAKNITIKRSVEVETRARRVETKARGVQPPSLQF